jgi:hypothetical protein
VEFNASAGALWSAQPARPIDRTMRANSYAKRFVGKLRREGLDHHLLIEQGTTYSRCDLRDSVPR